MTVVERSEDRAIDPRAGPTAREVLLESRPRGIPLFVMPTPLSRLRYFDGQLLRAERLDFEQHGRRRLAALSHAGAGAGIVHGFHLHLAADALTVCPGLAFDAEGFPLLLPEKQVVSLAALLADAGATSTGRAKQAAASGPAFRLHALVLARAERPGRAGRGARTMEGVWLAARPLALTRALPVSRVFDLDSTRHLRSRVASALFRAEHRADGSWMSATRLASDAWCAGALAPGGREVPIGLVAFSGDRFLFLDTWSLRREHLECTPRRYWNARLGLRSRGAFLAEVLQFQCQLAGAPDADLQIPEESPGPCAGVMATLRAVEAELLTDMVLPLLLGRSGDSATTDSGKSGAFDVDFTVLEPMLAGLDRALSRPQTLSGAGQLVRRGFVELPPAGYLAVHVDERRFVNEQMETLMGEGVALHFCAIRADDAAGELEEARHLERISLVDGIDDPTRRPDVDILVPDGRVLPPPPRRDLCEVGAVLHAAAATAAFRGVARWIPRDGTFQVAALGRAAGLLEAWASFANDLASTDPLPAAPVTRVLLTPALLVRAQGLAARSSRATAAASGAAHEQALLVESTLTASGPALGRSRPRRLRLALGLVEIGDPAPSLTIELDGTLRTEAARTPITGKAAEVTYLDGDLTVCRQAGGATAEIRASESGSWALQVHEESASDSRTVRIELVPAAKLFRRRPALPGFVVESVWNEAAGRGSLGVGEMLPDRDRGPDEALVRRTSGNVTYLERRLATFDLVRNAGIADAAQPHHILARGALRLAEGAGVALDPMVRRIETALFAPPADAEPRILAIRDWILFRRSRRKTCVIDTTPRATSPRRFRVFERLVHSQREAADLAAALADPARQDEARSFLAREHDPLAMLVDFEAHRDTLKTHVSAIRSEWDGLEPGERIALSLIASAAMDSAMLQSRRLDRLEGLLAPRSVPDPARVRVAMTRVPDALATFDAEGAILFLTRAETTRHPVYRVRQAADADRIRGLVAGGRIADAAADALVERLGDVAFADESDAPDVPALDAARMSWDQLGGEDVAEAFLAHAPSDADTVARWVRQSQRIVEAFPGGATPTPIPVPAAFPRATPAITFLVPPAPPPIG